MSERDPVQREETAELARSLCEQAAQLHEQADYATARTLYERSLAIQEKLLGRVHADTARSLHGLAQVQMKQGEEAQARQLLEEALAIQEKMLGPEHPDTAASLHTLGELASNQGDSETGSELMARAFILRQLVLGSEHPDTIESSTLLALMLAQQGEVDKAEQMLIHALSICESALGEDHRTTARVLNGLGRIYAASKATYARARPLYERALGTYERLLGPDHPQTALVLNNLAALLSNMQNFEAALPLLERSLAAHERIYGSADWRITFGLVNLADIHNRRGEHAAARPLLERALVIRERAWGGRRPETVSCLRKLVATLGNLHRQGDEGAMQAGMAFYRCLTALEMADRELDAPGATLPGRHLDPAKAAQQLHRLVAKLEAEMARPPLSAAEQADLEAAGELAQQADELYQQGDYASAAVRLERALDLQERVLGEHHLDHIPLLRKLADARGRQGRYSAVLPLAQRVADIHVQVLGPDHPTTLLALSELVSCQAYEYGHAAARPLQDGILQAMEDALGPNDPMVRLARQSHDWLGEVLGEDASPQEPPGASLSERREEALAALSAGEEGPLAGLDEVDWHSLQHAYGPADDVPNLLRLLLSADRDVRDSAWQELYGNIWHQDDVYEATSYAVPFFIRLLNSEQALDKQDILGFLRAVATAGPWLSENQTWMEAALAQQERDFKGEVERAQLYASRAREAVSEGLESYLAHLSHPVPDVRQTACKLLCAFPEHGACVLPALAAQIEAEREVDVKARLVQDLGTYLLEALPAGERGPYVGSLADLVRSEKDARVRFAAAAALVRMAGDGTAPEAIEVLEEAVAHPQGVYPELADREDRSPLLGDIIVEEVCAALSHLGVESRIPILIRMLDRVTSPAQAHQVAVLLLDSALLGRGRAVSYSGTPDASEDEVFYGTVHPVAADGVEERIYPRADLALDIRALTPIQRQALQAVLDCPPVWSIHSNLLQLYGLPLSPTDPSGSEPWSDE